MSCSLPVSQGDDSAGRASLARSNSIEDEAIAAQALAPPQQHNSNEPIIPEPLLKILTSVEGKDRVFRITFFSLKVLRAVSQRELEPVQLFETALLDARRVFRLFREVEPLQALFRQVSSAGGDALLRMGAAIQLSGLIGFLITNHLILFTKVKLLKLDGGLLRKMYGFFLLIAQTAGVAQDLRRLFYLRKAYHSLNLAKAAASQAGNKQRHALLAAQDAVLRGFRVELLASVAKHSIEHVTCFYLIRGAYGKPWNNGIVGSAGTTTAAIQLWQLWRTTSTRKALGARQAVENFKVLLD